MLVRTVLPTILGAIVLAGFLAVADRAGGQNNGSSPLTYLDVALVGSEVVDGSSGDPAGHGFASLEVDADAHRVCYLVAVSGVARPTAFQVRLGGRSATGTHLLHVDEPVSASAYLADAAEWSGCQSVPKDTARALTTVTAAYVQVYSETHPWGAVRGQIGSGEPFFLEAGLVGGNPRPGPGDEPVSGLVDVTRYGTILCYDLAASAVDTVDSAAISRVGTAPERVLDLELQQAVRRSGLGERSIEASRCIDAPAGLVDELANDPSGFVVEVWSDTPATLGVALGPSIPSPPVASGRVDQLPPFAVTELTGRQVVHVEGDADGAASVGLTLYDGMICQQVRTAGSDRPTGLRIRDGHAGTTGPVLYDAWIWLDPFTPIGSASYAFAACRAVPDKLIEILLDEPERYYLEMTTFDHPLGAFRSQLG